MDQFFPFNLPAPTAWYAVLYVVTLLMHAVFMSYVLAGSIMLGVAGLRGMLGRPASPSAWSAVTTVLKDWMPFALSAAITAGIAPLLFVQILYQQEFYTANLLSFHRWMAILPVLIVAFYLLYLLKAHRIEGKTAVQGVVAMVVMVCILFVGWSWVENHLLSLDQAAWAKQYETKAMVYVNVAIAPRLAFWIASALPTACLLLAWQLRGGASGSGAESAQRAQRPLAIVASLGLIVAAALAWPVVSGVLPPGGAGTQQSSMWAGMVIAGIGVLLQLGVWLVGAVGRPLRTVPLWIASAGMALAWLGVLVAREAARLSIIASEAVFARHERVGTLAGLVIFLAFAIIGVGSIAWIVRAVAKAQRQANRTIE